MRPSIGVVAYPEHQARSVFWSLSDGRASPVLGGFSGAPPLRPLRAFGPDWKNLDARVDKSGSSGPHGGPFRLEQRPCTSGSGVRAKVSGPMSLLILVASIAAHEDGSNKNGFARHPPAFPSRNPHVISRTPSRRCDVFSERRRWLRGNRASASTLMGAQQWQPDICVPGS